MATTKTQRGLAEISHPYIVKTFRIVLDGETSTTLVAAEHGFGYLQSVVAQNLTTEGDGLMTYSSTTITLSGYTDGDTIELTIKGH